MEFSGGTECIDDEDIFDMDVTYDSINFKRNYTEYDTFYRKFVDLYTFYIFTR